MLNHIRNTYYTFFIFNGYIYKAKVEILRNKFKLRNAQKDNFVVSAPLKRPFPNFKNKKTITQKKISFSSFKRKFSLKNFWL